MTTTPACDCEPYEFRSACSPPEPAYNKARVRAVGAAVHKIALVEHAYTVDELERLAWEFADRSDASTDCTQADAIKHRLYLGMFIVWLGQRERAGRWV